MKSVECVNDACKATLDLEPFDSIYDGERYRAECPACGVAMAATASVVITFRVERADEDEYFDDSVGAKVVPVANAAPRATDGAALAFYDERVAVDGKRFDT